MLRVPSRRNAGTPHLVLLLSAVVLGLAVLAGCGRKETAARPEKPASQTEAAPLGEALRLWSQGDASGASDAFLKADFSQGTLFPKDSPLAMSEAELASLPSSERPRKVEEIMKQTDAIKKLAGHVAKLGRDAVARKDFETARGHFEKLRAFGESLEQANPPKITQLVAQAIKKLADQGLASLPR